MKNPTLAFRTTDDVPSASPKKGWCMSNETKSKINWSLACGLGIFFLTNTVYLTHLATHIEEIAEQGVKEITGIRNDFREVQKAVQDLQIRTSILEKQRSELLPDRTGSAYHAPWKDRQ